MHGYDPNEGDGWGILAVELVAFLILVALAWIAY